MNEGEIIKDMYRSYWTYTIRRRAARTVRRLETAIRNEIKNEPREERRSSRGFAIKVILPQTSR